MTQIKILRVAVVGFAVVLFSVLAPWASFAQEASIWDGVEELLVTGSSAAGLVQKEAISVLGFDDLELKAGNITDISGLAEKTPNLEIKTGASSVSSPTIFIRGIGLLDFNSNASSSVAIINDGVYQNSPLGQLFQFYDLEGVDVLRGPQASRYGRNATAGAILVRPKRPDGEFSASFTGTYGSFNQRQVEAAVGFPIYEDILSARFSGRFSQRDGYTRNRCSDPQPTLQNSGVCDRSNGNEGSFGPVASGLPKWVNDEDNWGARGILRFQPPNLDTDWVLNINGGRSQGLAFQFQSRGVRPVAAAFGGRPGIGQDNFGYADNDDDPFAGDFSRVEPEELDLFAASLNGTTQFGDWTLKSVTGYSSAKLKAERDFDASPNQTAEIIQDDKVWQFSEDLLLTSDFSDDFEFELGAFFLYEFLDSRQDLLEGVVRIPQIQEKEQETVTWAVAASGSYFLTDALKLEGGVRYNWERKQFDLGVRAAPSVQSPDIDINDLLSVPPESQEAITDEVTGEVVLTWLATEEVSVYAKYSHGFKGAHFNGGAFFSGELIEAVDPEIIDAFEIGLKSQFFDGRVALNAAAWYYDYENYQVFVVQNTQDSAPLSQLLNAPRVESRGIEVDLKTEPIDGFNLDISLAVLDAQFSEFSVERSFVPLQCDPQVFPCPREDEVLNFTGNQLVAAPPISLNVLAFYDIDLGRFGTITPRFEAQYRDQTFFTPGEQFTGAPGESAGASQSAYWLMNARLAYRTPDDIFELAFWVRNLADQVYLSNALDTSVSLGKFLDVNGPPRTMGATLRMNW